MKHTDKLQHTARLSEKAVQAAASGQLTSKRKPPKQPAPVSKVKVHPLIKVYLEHNGLKLSDARVEVHNSEEIVIWNPHD